MSYREIPDRDHSYEQLEAKLLRAEMSANRPGQPTLPVPQTSSPARQPNSRGPGRPQLLADPVKQREILACIAIGASQQAAANYVGVHVQTLRRLVRTNPDFRQCYTAAQAKHERFLVECIDAAARVNWRAAAWKLERTNPAYSRPARATNFNRRQTTLLIHRLAQLAGSIIPAAALRKRFVQAVNDVLALFFPTRRSRPGKRPPPHLPRPQEG